MPKRNRSAYAIGVFDSGLGGLTVVKEIKRLLPHENIVYFGDTARVPYGIKSERSIVQFSIENTKVLLKHKVKIVVVACNSCSSYAIPALKRRFRLPIVGVINPGARKAVEVTQNRRIGVIATSATVKSRKYNKTIKQLRPSASVFSQACPLFVPLVEEGWLTKAVTLRVAKEYLKALRAQRIDTLILGCTHYPLLKSVLQKSVGRKVSLIDSAQVVAGEVRDVLTAKHLLNSTSKKGKAKFFISDRPQQFNKIARNFLGQDIKAVKCTM